MTPLAERLTRRIARQGPITVADYMAAVLTDPEHGYYMTGDPLGRRGDFITAPEISQMFGELIGLWCADTWQRLGAPGKVVLLELGPGRGTLMADALRAARLDPAFLDAVRVHLVEVSPVLRARQATALAEYAPTWHADLGGLPDGPLLVIANEFFDALPVHQYERRLEGWCERLVGLDDADALAFGLSPPTPATALLVPGHLRDAPPGSVIEVSPVASSLAAEIGGRIAAFTGAALVIDYGHGTTGIGDSLQAVRHHARHQVLDEPGRADLTAHVDFAALGQAARAAGARIHGPETQGAFLERLGLGARADALSRSASPEHAQDIAAAKERLSASEHMGVLFKVLALSHPALEALPGFG